MDDLKLYWKTDEERDSLIQKSVTMQWKYKNKIWYLEMCSSVTAKCKERMGRNWPTKQGGNKWGWGWKLQISRCVRTRPNNVWRNEKEGEKSISKKNHAANEKSS